jgi:Protein of unknown function (DUF4197)
LRESVALAWKLIPIAEQHLDVRRALLRSVWLLPALPLAALLPGRALAGPLDAFTNIDATRALRAALDTGSLAAIGKLGVDGGFLNNPQVKIPLPDGLRKIEGVLRAMGRGADLDALQASMNRAAELAVPQAKQMVASAVKAMTVADAKGILGGGEDSVTQFFKGKTLSALTERFLPIVSATVSKIGLAKRYNDIAGQASQLGLIDKGSARIESFVTGKALDGLYFMIAQEEKAIRADPVRAGGAILRKVFGALQ